MTENFRFFAPASTISKAKNKENRDIFYIEGLASTDSKDADNEHLDYNGFDLDDFNLINWDHKKEPKYIIGEPVSHKIIPGKGMMIKGMIYPDSEVGQEAIALMKAMKKSPKGNRLGFSVEGQVIERDLLNPKKITKAKITAVALCPFPKNQDTFAELVEKGFSTDSFVNTEGLDPSSANGGDTVEFVVDMTDEKGNRIVIDKNLNIKITKAVTTENAAALKKEDLEDSVKQNRDKALTTLVKGHQEGLVDDETLLNAYDTYDSIEKGGKRAIIGEIRTFGGKKYHKTENGWRPLKKDHPENKKEGGELEDIKVGDIILDFDTLLISLYKEMKKNPSKYKQAIKYLDEAGSDWDKVGKLTLAKKIKEDQSSNKEEKSDHKTGTQDVSDQLRDTPVGSVASGGGYGPFTKINNSTWTEGKVGKPLSNDAVAERLSGFTDFKVDNKSDKKYSFEEVLADPEGKSLSKP